MSSTEPRSPRQARRAESTQLFAGARASPARASPARASPLTHATVSAAPAVAVDPRVAETATRRRPSLRDAGAGLAERIVNTIADIVALVRLCVRR